jgi:glycosyltransferase involved in cell wall biosynthesis
MGRINTTDSDNNGLLLRNLFSNWPREKLAQIYSSGDEGDAGFFGHYYKMGPQDRRMGRLFYRLKSEVLSTASNGSLNQDNFVSKIAGAGSWTRRYLIDTGLYELCFVPRVSQKMKSWVRDFSPDVIFAQGYNLTFATLPFLLKKVTHAKLAFFCSDDWPTYLYAGLLGEPRLFCWFIRPIVKQSVARLLAATDMPLAFGQSMADEYAKRYGKPFTVLSHADDQQRFESAQSVRVHPTGTITLMAIGNFNQYRWPLLLDANESCNLLELQGIHVRVAILSSAIDPQGACQLAEAAYIDILDDPGNDKLPCYLKGADLLFLAEGFDEGFVSAIRLSISSKAHLFMFSQRPIIVYAHPDTGIAKYVSTYRWGKLVNRRSSHMLAEAIENLLSNDDEVRTLIAQANSTAKAFHSHEANLNRLRSALTVNTDFKE